jgi:hypothetical protein
MRTRLQSLTCRATPVLLVILATASGGRSENAAHASQEPRASFEWGDDVPGIIGGTAVETCEWPSVVGINAASPTDPNSIQVCTGTLIHPEIVITAAHCNEVAIELIVVGDNRKQNPRSLPFDYCKSHPGWSNATKHGKDYAFCKLSKPVTDVPIVPVLMGCEVDVLKAGQEVVGVGFGVQSPGGASGPKMKVTTEFTEFDGSGAEQEAWVGENGKGFCFGDSGGPVFVKLPEDKFGADAGWRVFGVTSGGDASCSGPAHFGVMWNWVGFVEEESGVDVTPCHDVDGVWNPGPDCNGAPIGDQVGMGSWPSCQPGDVGGKITTCGSNDGDDDDDESSSSSEESSDSTSESGESSDETSDSSSQSDDDSSVSSEESSDDEQESSDASDDSHDSQDASTSESSSSSGDGSDDGDASSDASDPDGDDDDDDDDDAADGQGSNDGCALAGAGASGGSLLSLMLVSLAFGRGSRRRGSRRTL